MPNADELRDLIQRVEGRGGPLRIVAGNYVGRYVTYGEGGHRVHPDDLGSDDIQDVLAGVLRRSLTEVGLRVVHDHDPSDVAAHGVVWIPDDLDVYEVVDLSDAAFGPDPLTAHLYAWLSAHAEGLVGRQEAPVKESLTTPPRDDLYDGRMPLEDDE